MNDISMSNNHLRVMTTVEAEVLGSDSHGRLGTEPETRVTMNFARETVNFDNR